MERLAARRLIQKYNHYPWPEEGSDDYFGPDDRREVLAKLFGLTLEEFKNKSIEIEPPFYCESRHQRKVGSAKTRAKPRVLYHLSNLLYHKPHIVNAADLLM